MNIVIDELLKKVQSQDEKISSNAITSLSFVLEMNSWGLSKGKRIDRYSSVVSQEIIEVNLDEADEAEIIKFIGDEIASGNDLTASLLFAMGQASSRIGLLPLIKIIEGCFDSFGENEVYQALVALERLLFFNESLSPEEERKIITGTKLIEVICRKILSFQSISRVDLESTCLRLLANLVLLLNEVTN